MKFVLFNNGEHKTESPSSQKSDAKAETKSEKKVGATGK